MIKDYWIKLYKLFGVDPSIVESSSPDDNTCSESTLIEVPSNETGHDDISKSRGLAVSLSDGKEMSDIPSANHFPIEPPLEEQIKQDISSKTEYPPNLSQWKMILSKNQNTYVIAGAGSGKSTSLVYRFFVLDRYLLDRNAKNNRNRITVFTFTRDSRQDFIDKLIEVYGKHGDKITQSEAEKYIRTFHSKLFQFGKNLKEFENFELLEFYKKSKQIKDENLGTDDIFHTTFQPQQRILIKEIFRDIFHNDRRFYNLIIKLIESMLYEKCAPTDKKDYEKQADMWQKYSDRDEKLATFLKKVFRKIPAPYKKLIKFRPIKKKQNLIFCADGEIERLQAYVVFVPEKDILMKYEKEYPQLNMHTRVKEYFLAYHSGKRIIYVHNEYELDLLRVASRWCQSDLYQKTGDIPEVKYALEGELKARPIYEAFYTAAHFVENMGLEVDDIGPISNNKSLSEEDRLFVKALIMFWKPFNQRLKKQRIYRFHDIFSKFRKPDSSSFGELPPSILCSMENLLIDEFQDISPEIVLWLNSVLTRLRKTTKDISLMCVGDDWQSIYGWRGSNPKYLIEYDRTFNFAPCSEIPLVENYRCYSDLIEDAESAIAGIGLKNRTDKKGCAQKQKEKAEETLEIIETDEKSAIMNKIREIILRDNGRFCPRNKERDVLHILSRKREPASEFRYLEILYPDKIKALTYHKSKGLQARYCILIGDCVYFSKADFKNLVTELSQKKHQFNKNQTYDEMQKDEALRLAYVAITRAKEKCFWFVNMKTGGAAEIVRNYKDDRRIKGRAVI